jgi:hypothetical protein
VNRRFGDSRKRPEPLGGSWHDQISIGKGELDPHKKTGAAGHMRASSSRGSPRDSRQNYEQTNIRK